VRSEFENKTVIEFEKHSLDTKVAKSLKFRVTRRLEKIAQIW
jgi:hypothetical protein